MNSFAGMERVTLIALFIDCVGLHSASANLTVTPRDTESKVNDSMYFNCSTDILSKEIHWSHGSNDVYAGGSFYEPYLGRFRIEINSSTGAYNLVIPSVEPRDAGEYTCQDDGGHGKQSPAAKLIVLADEPTCQSKLIQDGNSCELQPGEVQLSCSVAYHGNIPPKLEWRKAGENYLIEKATSVVSGNITTYFVTLKTDLSMDSQSYVCQTTRSVTSQYNCKSETIRLQYVFSGNATVKIAIDEELKCSANSSQSCSYKWKWFSGSDSLTMSTDQTLKPTKVGLHRCEATCPIGNTSCVVDVMFAEVHSTEATSAGQMLWLLVLLLVIFLITIIIIVVVLCRRHTRANERPSTSQELVANITKQEQSTAPLIAEHNNDQVKKSDAEPNKDPKEEVETNTTDKSTTPLIGFKAKDKEQEKQSLAEADHGPTEVGAIKTDRPKAPLTASTVEDKKEVKQNDADANKSPKGLSLLEGETEIVPTTIKREGNITGVTVSKDKLVIATENPSAVDVYDVKTFQWMRRVPINKLVNLFDIACYHLSDHVFISGSQLETETKVIVRILILREDPTQIVDKLWSTGDDFGNLSVSSESNVLLCVSDKNKLIEYTRDGNKTRVINLRDLVHPRHAIKLPGGEFLVSHGFKNDTLHQVCNVNNNGEVVRSFDAEKGQQLKDPNYLIVDEDGYVLVLDSCINRVLLLDSGLKNKREFVTKRAVLIDPSKMCLCKATRNLFVVHAANEVLIFTIK